MIRPASVLTAIAVTILAASSAIAQGPMPGYIPPGVTYGQNVVNYRVNQHGPSWNDRQPIEAFLTQMGQRSWFRMEYLHWDLEGPGSGAPGFAKRRADRTVLDPPVGEVVFFGDATDPDLNPNLVQPDPFFFEQSLDQFPETVFINPTEDLLGTGFLPSFSSLTLNDSQGVRGTYGIWMESGSALEFSVFGGGTTDRFSVAGLVNERATSPQGLSGNVIDFGVGTLGAPNLALPLEGDVFIAFDESYRHSMQGKYWGSELNFLTAPISTAAMIQWQWLGGLRYLNYDEQFRQNGVYTDGGTLAGPTSLNVRSTTTNNTYGPTVGFRTMVDSKYLTLSVTPRVSFALNNYTAKGSSVYSDAALVDPVTSRFKTDEVDFTTVAQVSFLAEVHVSESFTLHGGYDFLWNYNVARSYNQPFYGTAQTIADDTIPNISFRDNPESMLIEGVSFGATWRF